MVTKPQLTASSQSRPSAWLKARKEKQRGDTWKKKFGVRRRIERLPGGLHDVVVRLLPVAAEDRRTERECNDASCSDAHRSSERSAFDSESAEIWIPGAFGNCRRCGSMPSLPEDICGREGPANSLYLRSIRGG